MRLTKVEIQNFKCFLDVEVQFPDNNGLFLITGTNKKRPALGSNGLGKSTLLDAICWCLYEKTSAGEKARTLLNRQAKGGYAVVLYFEKGGNTHRLVRTWNPNQVQLDGADLKNEEVVDFIGLTFEQFLFSIYFPQGGTSFIDLSASEKLSFLSKLFQLDKWVACSEKCKEKIQAIKLDYAKTEVEIKATQNTQQQTEASIADLMNKESTWQETKDAQLDELRLSVETLNAELKDTEDASVLKQVVEELMQEKSKLTYEESSINKTISQLEKAIAVEESKINQQIDRVEKMTSKSGSKCSLCEQMIPDSHVAKVSSVMLADIENLSSNLEAMTPSVEVSKKQLKEVKAKIEKNQQELTEAVSSLRSLESRNAMNTEKRKQFERLVKQMEAKSNETNPYTTMIGSLVEQLNKLELKIVELTQKCGALSTEQSHYEFWQNRFPQIRLNILNEVVEELDMHFNQALATLGLLDWEVSIATERQLKNESTKAELNMKLIQDGTEVSLSSLSGGERRRIGICSDIGLADLIKSRCEDPLNLLLLDEPFASLSQEGIENSLLMLQSLSESQTVMLAEHRVLELSKFDGVYEVTKEADDNSNLRVK